jgi:hypothetical protein
MELHLSFRDVNNVAWRTVRRADTTWSSFEDIRSRVLSTNPGFLYDPGSVSAVDSVGLAGDFNFVACHEPSDLSFTRLSPGATSAAGVWRPFISVDRNAFASLTGVKRYVSVGTTAINGELHICAVVAQGSSPSASINVLYHTMLTGANNWSVPDPVPSRFEFIDCAEVDNQIHLCGVALDPTNPSQLMLSIRSGPGNWTPLLDIRAKVLSDNPGSPDPLKFRSVGCVGLNGELHVFVVGDAGDFRHTIRRLNTTWHPFHDVQAEIRREHPRVFAPCLFEQVGCAAIGGDIHICAEAEGKLWHAIRFQNGTWTPFGDVRGVVQAQNPGSPIPAATLGSISLASV